MEINPAYGKYRSSRDSRELLTDPNKLSSPADNLYEMIEPATHRPIIVEEKSPAQPNNVKQAKKSLKLPITMCVVFLVALLALAVAVVAITLTLILFLDDSRQQIQTLQSQLNISYQDIQTLQSQVNNSNQLIQSLELKLNDTREMVNQTTQLQNNQNAAVMDEVNAIQNIVNMVHSGIGDILNPATSCGDISQDRPSGEYWVQNSSSTFQVYCDTSIRNCSCSTGGWMPVANLDMTDPNQQCPDGFRQIDRSTAPMRTCGRPDGGFRGCVSTVFPTHGLEYSHVCGRIIAYQFGAPEAFAPHLFNTQLTLSDTYMDGVSLTHGLSPREHIWSFAAALNEVLENLDSRFYCPCIDPNATFTVPSEPSFVGQDYFCDTGGAPTASATFYDMDPLWDGAGCESASRCCEFNNPPWFCKQLPEPTTDDIELRLCGNVNIEDEDVPLELVEIFVR